MTLLGNTPGLSSARRTYNPDTMNQEPRIAIIIPTYNERDNIEEIIESIENSLNQTAFEFHIIVVDDNSSDGTARICENLSGVFGNIAMINRQGKLGLGSAYIEGITFALKNVKPSVIVSMDADGSHSPKYLLPMINQIISNNYDVVVGSRKISGGGVEGWGWYRKNVSSIASTIARNLCGLTIKDVTSGYRAYSAEKISLVIGRLKSKNFEFQVEVLYQLKLVGGRMGEHPIIFPNRTKGKSKLTKKQVFRFLFFCAGILIKRITLPVKPAYADSSNSYKDEPF